MYNGMEKVKPTDFWTMDAPASKAPFYYDGITYDEFYVESYYYGACSSMKKTYKSLRKQLVDGDITSIPDEYKALCPFPEKCTAFSDLIKAA